ncbi:MAG: PP2C family protein-serine/threonine phosphatase, partial [Myxococcales bacterium]|nr:PP2C family protein-serine/threonine phosphatase [Myxococcales bacterium]
MRVYTDRKHAFATAETALLRSIASQATSVIINSRLYIEAAQAERYQQQFKHAGDIQRRMIPDRLPAHPKIAFAYVYEPSAEVGGDFFDFYALPESHEIGLCIADVVGKGIPAALMMASLRTAFRLYACSVVEITEIMTMINIHMTRETLISEFATMFYGVFAENGRRLSYCCAGHDPPLHWRAGRIRQLATGDFVIGVEPNESFSKKNLPLKKDDVIVFYTDGIVDASNFAGDNFGRERLSGALAKYAEGSADRIAQ